MTARRQGSDCDVAVVGGGVIGLAIAEALTRRGAEVVLLEAARCGEAASAGNAGWVTPGLSAPISAPGTVRQGLRWMLSPDAPLRIAPTLRPSLGRWVFDFWRCCSASRYAAGVAAIASLSGRALDDFDALAERLPPFEMYRRGILFVAETEAALAAEAKSIEFLRDNGYDGAVETLDPTEARRAEPSLAGDLAGAIFAGDERHVRPESLTAAFVSRLRGDGVELREMFPVASLSRASGVWSVEGPGGVVRAPRVVIATGAAASTLLTPLGVRVPLQGAKGYSLTQPDPGLRLRHAVYLLDSKLAVSPFDGALRLAGTLELGARGLDVPDDRIAAIKRAAAKSFSGWGESVDAQVWAGMRPVVPDGLPVLGPVPGHQGLHVATAHAMLGVTLAPTTAEVLAPAILDDPTAAEALTPFSVGRFKRGFRG